MTYARLCEHKRFEPHWKSYDRPYPENDWCSGGEFLAEDTLIFEPENCEMCGGTGSVTHPAVSEREHLEGLREDQCPRCRNGKTYPGLEAFMAWPPLDGLSVREGE